MVTSNTYIAVRLTDNKIVGVIDFRHNIDNHPILSVWGGHIGYSVRPCERKKVMQQKCLDKIL
ncbi:putative acetyltransferase [[Clostridium] sordellii ATCC 9714]|nr:putative acetyltransferase [[Clostridium] sordellii ATCC 9714] [Paeniclostridium sordellii ATCC 9714]